MVTIVFNISVILLLCCLISISFGTIEWHAGDTTQIYYPTYILQGVSTGICNTYMQTIQMKHNDTNNWMDYDYYDIEYHTYSWYTPPYATTWPLPLSIRIQKADNSYLTFTDIITDYAIDSIFDTGIEFCSTTPELHVNSRNNNFILVNQLDVWADANVYCINTFGTTLASIHSDAEQFEINGLVSSVTVNDCGANHFWLGATNYSYNAQLSEWTDGTAIDYVNLAALSCLQKCMYLSPVSPTWYCTSCTVCGMPFVCNAPNPTPTPTTDPTTTDPTTSPSNNPTISPSRNPTLYPTAKPTVAMAPDATTALAPIFSTIKLNSAETFDKSIKSNDFLSFGEINMILISCGGGLMCLIVGGCICCFYCFCCRKRKTSRNFKSIKSNEIPKESNESSEMRLNEPSEIQPALQDKIPKQIEQIEEIEEIKPISNEQYISKEQASGFSWNGRVASEMTTVDVDKRKLVLSELAGVLNVRNEKRNYKVREVHNGTYNNVELMIDNKMTSATKEL